MKFNELRDFLQNKMRIEKPRIISVLLLLTSLLIFGMALLFLPLVYDVYEQNVYNNVPLPPATELFAWYSHAVWLRLSLFAVFFISSILIEIFIKDRFWSGIYHFVFIWIGCFIWFFAVMSFVIPLILITPRML